MKSIVKDPTENVIALAKADNKRQDDLREAFQHHIEALVIERAQTNKEAITRAETHLALALELAEKRTNERLYPLTDRVSALEKQLAQISGRGEGSTTSWATVISLIVAATALIALFLHHSV